MPDSNMLDSLTPLHQCGMLDGECRCFCDCCRGVCPEVTHPIDSTHVHTLCQDSVPLYASGKVVYHVFADDSPLIQDPGQPGADSEAPTATGTDQADGYPTGAGVTSAVPATPATIAAPPEGIDNGTPDPDKGVITRGV